MLLVASIAQHPAPETDSAANRREHFQDVVYRGIGCGGEEPLDGRYPILLHVSGLSHRMHEVVYAHSVGEERGSGRLPHGRGYGKSSTRERSSPASGDASILVPSSR